MSQVLVTEDYLEDIADAIRSRNGSSNTYTPAQMATAINNLNSGGIDGNELEYGLTDGLLPLAGVAEVDLAEI